MSEDKIDNDQVRFLKYVDKRDNGCWYWTGSTAITGYGNFYYKGRVCLAHRASLYIFNRSKALTPGLQVSHSCGIRNCVNPNHLSEKTASENNGIDKKKHGTDNSGTRCHFSKLDWTKVSEIRDSNLKVKELSKTYGVSSSCISSILRKKTWKPLLVDETVICETINQI
jgi:hypothetical protein